MNRSLADSSPGGLSNAPRFVCDSLTGRRAFFGDFFGDLLLVLVSFCFLSLLVSKVEVLSTHVAS